jgi:hypothetical protein
MTFCGAVTSADAGKKGKRAHQGSGRVHISPTVSDKNLELLQRKLEGSSRHRATTHAVSKEIHDRSSRRAMDRMLSAEDGASAILSIGNLADEILKGRKRRH